MLRSRHSWTLFCPTKLCGSQSHFDVNPEAIFEPRLQTRRVVNSCVGGLLFWLEGKFHGDSGFQVVDSLGKGGVQVPK
jgi:hypothetical protein